MEEQTALETPPTAPSETGSVGTPPATTESTANPVANPEMTDSAVTPDTAVATDIGAAEPGTLPDLGDDMAVEGGGALDGINDAGGLEMIPPEPVAFDNPYGIEALWAQGDLIIKSVAVILLLMSIASWYVIVSRGITAMRLRRAARRSQRFWHAQSLEEGLDHMGGTGANNPFKHLVEEGAHARDHHVARRQELHGQLGLAEWLTACLRTAIDECAERMQSGLSVLASVGSTAPFVGLFGTVWGIYHALVGIGVSGQASIDKVAGPVGEALIMTAFGLAVAIPAVLGYNMLVRSNKGVLGHLNRFAHQLHALLVTGAPVARIPTRVSPLKREAS